MPKTKKYTAKVEKAPQPQSQSGVIDDQVERIIVVIGQNLVLTSELDLRLGGPGEPPSEEPQVVPTISGVLDIIHSKLEEQRDALQAIHERMGNTLGKVKLY